MKKSKSDLLKLARKRKKDEFYTMYETIEKELQHYFDVLENKIIYCNCDDPYLSNFVKFFIFNFNKMKLKKLKKLIVSCFSYEMQITECFDYESVEEIDIKKLLDNGKNSLINIEDGDFRSDRCVKLLDESDVVITNPPFSLFGEFVNLIIEHNKKFLILGNINSISRKDVFPLFQNEKIWIGKTIHSGDVKFFVPDDYDFETKNSGFFENGKRYIGVTSIRWFTNLKKFPIDFLNLTKTYNETDYKKYDNYDAIEIDKVKNIPIDYYGEMGVPITFLDKFNEKQFEIIGLDTFALKNKTNRKGRFVINGKIKYFRILIKHKMKMIDFY